MGYPVRFWFIKGYEKPFENILDIIREALNDAGAKEYALNALEVTAEAGENNIHRELTRGTAGKLRGIDLASGQEILVPPAAPRPEIAQLIQFRDFISPVKQLAGVLPIESLMEFTAQLSHKVGEILLVNATEQLADGYISFGEGRIISFGFRVGDEFILRYYQEQYALDMYNVREDFQAEGKIGKERTVEAVQKADMLPYAIEEHEEEMIHQLWQVSKEGFNQFYGTTLGSLGTTETNISTLHKVSDPGISHYEIYPDGVSYAYPQKTDEPTKKKPWWKVW
jgi:hypothetical protein